MVEHGPDSRRWCLAEDMVMREKRRRHDDQHRPIKVRTSNRGERTQFIPDPPPCPQCYCEPCRCAEIDARSRTDG